MEHVTENMDKKTTVTRFSESRLPTLFGDFDVAVYRCGPEQSEAVVISRGLSGTWQEHAQNTESVFLRIHSECFTGEVLSSQKCDCKDQLDKALKIISREGHGLVIYLRQEGRGIGLGNKILAYGLQEKEGLDTVQANTALGFKDDLRDFSYAVLILKDLNIRKVRLNTNNPDKINSLRDAGIDVIEVVPSITRPNVHNSEYLRTKYHKMGHSLDRMFPDAPEGLASKSSS
ncbi:MAG: GTP cyclohydrolase II [Deltaproteobacteria bacterium]|nr:GTP cyclohydrolase II [Deltaproteobacteria bacterium]